MLHFNKYINRVGIEFEGFWSWDRDMFYEGFSEKTGVSETELRTLFAAPHSDGTIEEKSTDTSKIKQALMAMGDVDTYEVITRPLTSKKLTRALHLIAQLIEQGDYIVNDSCGLHFHVSTKGYQPFLHTKSFYHTFVAMFAKTFPSVHRLRKTNTYCKPDLNEGDLMNNAHFKRQSSGKYHYINYQYEALGTMEVRAYGSRLATMEGLEECIQKTVDLVRDHIKGYKESIYKKTFEYEPRPEELNKDISELCEMNYFSFFSSENDLSPYAQKIYNRFNFINMRSANMMEWVDENNVKKQGWNLDYFCQRKYNERDFSRYNKPLRKHRVLIVGNIEEEAGNREENYMPNLTITNGQGDVIRTANYEPYLTSGFAVQSGQNISGADNTTVTVSEGTTSLLAQQANNQLHASGNMSDTEIRSMNLPSPAAHVIQGIIHSIEMGQMNQSLERIEEVLRTDGHQLSNIQRSHVRMALDHRASLITNSIPPEQNV